MPTIILDCAEITKTYTTIDPPTRVLHGVGLQVPEERFSVTMGASGSGKSILLCNISDMDRPTAGAVRLEGQELTGLNDEEISGVRLTRMGLVFQQVYFLSSLTTRDNVLPPALRADPRRVDGTTSQVDTLLDQFGIGHVKQHGITEISGGQLQHVSIRRTLAGKPAIVLADEPTGALNSPMTAETVDALSGVHAEGQTIVMVTHDPAYMTRTDRAMCLRDERLVDSRSMER